MYDFETWTFSCSGVFLSCFDIFTQVKDYLYLFLGFISASLQSPPPPPSPRRCGVSAWSEDMEHTVGQTSTLNIYFSFFILKKK